MSSESNQAEQYEVQQIIDKRLDKKGNIEYKVIWVGYPEDEATWEPENGLVGCVELVRSYEEEVNATEQGHSQKKSQQIPKKKEKVEKSQPTQKKVNQPETKTLKKIQQKKSNVIDSSSSKENEQPKMSSQLLQKRKQAQPDEDLEEKKKKKIKSGDEDLEKIIRKVVLEQQKKNQEKSHKKKHTSPVSKIQDISADELQKLKQTTQKELNEKLKKMRESQDALKKSIPQGHYKFQDTALAIKQSHKSKRTNKLEFVVEWKVRSDGTKPLDTTFENEDLKLFDPYLLLAYYESKTQFKETGPSIKKVNEEANIQKQQQEQDQKQKQQQSSEEEKVEDAVVMEEEGEQSQEEINKILYQNNLEASQKQVENVRGEESSEENKNNNERGEMDEEIINIDNIEEVQQEQLSQKNQEKDNSNGSQDSLAEQQQQNDCNQINLEDLNQEEEEENKIQVEVHAEEIQKNPSQQDEAIAKKSNDQLSKNFPVAKIKQLIKTFLELHFSSQPQQGITAEILSKKMQNLISLEQIKQYLNLLCEEDVIEEKNGQYFNKEK